MAREGGYTILEAGLAIAVSSSLVLLTLGLSTMVARQRFHDTMTTAHTFVQSQYSEVRTSINSRTIGANANQLSACVNDGNSKIAANSKNCYTLGRLISFGGNEIKVSYVIGVMNNTGINWPDTDKTGDENLRMSGFNLVVVSSTNSGNAGVNATTKSLNGDATIVGGWFISDNRTSAFINRNNLNLAILRNPLDGSLLTYVNSTIRSNGQLVLSNQSNMRSDQKLAIGIKNESFGYPGGLLCIAGGDSASGISNNFNTGNAEMGINWDKPDLADNFAKVVNGCANWEVK